MQELKDTAQWLRVTLASIGDGVITTDPHGKVTMMNPVAQALTGWTQEEAVGRSLTDVFRIVNQETRAEVENPALRALRDGVIVGLANHTILIAKDGTERNIDDSAAPITTGPAIGAGKAGEVAGAVLVFRDITERYRQEMLVQHERDYCSNILATLRQPFLVLDKDLRVVTANRSFYKTFKVEKEQTEGVLVYELGGGEWNIPALRTALEEILPRNGHTVEGFVVEHHFNNGVGDKVMSLSARRVRKPGTHSQLILLGIEDITERTRDESFLRCQKGSLELAVKGEPLERVLDFLARAMEGLSRGRFVVAIHLMEADGFHFGHVAAPSLPARYAEATKGMDARRELGFCSSAVVSHTPTIVPDFADPLPQRRWPAFTAEVVSLGLRGCFTTPILSPDQRVLGTFAIYYREPLADEPGPHDRQLVEFVTGTVALAVDRTRVDGELHDSEVRYRRLFETAKDGILILDAHTGKITDANAFMGGLVGIETHELVGKELHEIGVFGDAEASKKAFKALQANRYLRYEHLPVQNQTGGTVEVEVVANVYHEGDRLVAQCNIRDISQRVVMENKIREQGEALGGELRRRDEFLAMLSHEIRNPLAPIRSAVHLLKNTDHRHETTLQKQARQVIERQVGNLAKIVGDLMEVSRVISGRIRMDLAPVDLHEVIRHAAETAAPLLEQRGHALSLDLCEDGPLGLLVKADATRLEQVFINLLTNAAKYTPDGGKIGVACERGTHGGEHAAVVRVRDNGEGIDADLLPRLFDLFSQADRSLARSAGGLGIGLALAQRLVTLHGGTISAVSDGPGRGSEFTVTLPLLEDGERPRERAGVATAAPAEAGGVRVLVVDDNPDQALMLVLNLRQQGYSVQSAATGPEGLEAARQWRPDVVLLDIGLPGLSGYEVARRLRADPAPGAAGVKMRLIALTGYGREEDVALATEAGFDAHLVKPVAMGDVVLAMDGAAR